MKRLTILPAFLCNRKAWFAMVGSILLMMNLPLHSQDQEEVPEGKTANPSVTLDADLIPYAGGNVLLDRLREKSGSFETSGHESILAEDPLEALQGRVPGVQVSSLSGAPGEGTFVSIRGLNTYLFNHDPVILVDGVPTLTTQDLNYMDIESIRIVKDLSTAALYGSKGSNGLVLITTKAGGLMSNAVEFNASWGMATPPKFQELLNGQQAFDLMQELNAPFAATPGDKSVFWGPSDHVSGVNINTGDLKNMDWQDELFQNVFQQNYSLAFSGGTDKTMFRIAGSWQKNEGVVDPSSFSRMTLAFNLNKKIGERLDFSTGFYLSKSRQIPVNTDSSAQGGGVILSALATPPFLPMQDAQQIESGGYFINPIRPQINNVGANANGVFDEINRTSVLLRFAGSYWIVEGLKLHVVGSTNIGLNRRNLFLSTTKVYIGRVNRGLAYEAGQEKYLWDAKGYLSYDRSFSDHNISLMAGGGWFGSNNGFNEAIGVDYTNDDIKLVSGTPTISFVNSNVNKFSTKSWLAAVDYNYDEKYFIGLNVRGDGSSRFSSDLEVISDFLDPEVWEISKKPTWGTFLGANLAWNMAREGFLDGADAITNLTLHASYGMAGNDGGNFSGRIYPYYWKSPLSGFNPDEDYVEALFPGIGFSILNLQNQRWESSSEMEAGIDLGLVKDRVSVSAAYYSRRTVDVIMPDLSDSTYRNSGEYKAGGLEIGLNTLNILKENFKWSTQLNFTSLNNQVEKVDGSYSCLEVGYGGHSNVIKPGEPVYALWGYETEGIFQNQGEVDNNASLPGAGPGDVRYKDQNGDNAIDGQDRVVLGDPNPHMIIGFDNTFQLGNFEINLFFYGMIGQDVLNLTRMQTEGLNDWINQSAAALNSWTGEGTSNEIPRASIGTINTQLSDRFIEKGSFFRLKYLSLGYNLPSGLIDKIGMKKCKVYLTAQNLFTLTGYKGYDPEVSSMGPLSIDYGAFPSTRYLGGGISVGF